MKTFINSIILAPLVLSDEATNSTSNNTSSGEITTITSNALNNTLDLPNLPNPLQMLQQGRRFNSIVSMAFNTVTTTYNRNDFESRIKRYGCHCFPGSNKSDTERHSAIGSGKAVDDIDNVCRRLSRCHRCIEIMYPGEIDVNDGRYAWDYDINTKMFDCSKNKNPARLALCECDASFAVEMGKTWDDNSYNESYWLNNRNNRQQGEASFDYEATCSKNKVPGGNGNGNHVTVADKCCGVGFEPYNSANKNCCEASGKVYDPNLHECCEDGSVKTFGGC